MKYRLEVEAVQYKGGDTPFSEYPAWLSELFATRRIEWNTEDYSFSLKPYPDYDLYDFTGEGYIELGAGDWIVRYPGGEVTIMENDEFQGTGYKKVIEPKPVTPESLRDFADKIPPKTSPLPTLPDLNGHPMPKTEPYTPRTPEIWCHCSISTPPTPDPSPENVRVSQGGFPG